MKRSYSILLLTCLALPLLVSCNGFDGFRVHDKGHHFRSRVDPSFDINKTTNIGIYVFSDGKAIDGSSRPVDGIDALGYLFNPMRMFYRGYFTGMHPAFFTSGVTLDTRFEPDTSNSGPSLELARSLKEELEKRGFIATVVTDFGHKREVTATECMNHAAAKGFDAAMMVNYSGMSVWTEYDKTTTSYTGSYTLVTTHINKYEGYLYLPNASLFDTKTKTLVWENSYFGLVQRAQGFNLSGERMNDASTEAVLPYGDKTYFDAADKAVKMLFEPDRWPAQSVKFPTKLKSVKKL